MKLRLEAEPGELQARGRELVEGLSKAMHAHAPDLADALLKAIPEKPPVEMKHRALRDSMDVTRRLYAEALRGMQAEIGAALDARADEMVGLSKAGLPPTVMLSAGDQPELDALHRELAGIGYEARDFSPGGLLSGQSIPTLRALVAEHSGK